MLRQRRITFPPDEKKLRRGGKRQLCRNLGYVEEEVQAQVHLLSLLEGIFASAILLTWDGEGIHMNGGPSAADHISLQPRTNAEGR